MKLPKFLLAAALTVAFGHARASADFTSGSLYRTSGVPPWNAASGSFTIMLWVYGPSITGANNYFEADDGGSFNVYVNVGSASDSPTEPYFLTRTGEWHFNRDGTYVANPSTSFDVSRGWTFLAVSFARGGATNLYAWQAGVNNDALVHIPTQTNNSSIGGSGSVSTFLLGDESRFDEGCRCLMGPVYVYAGVALTQAQIDAQRQQLSPLITGSLIEFSSFLDAGSLATDGSGTANWSVHGSPGYSSANPPIAGVSGSGSSSSSSGGGSPGGSSSGSSGGGSSSSSSSSSSSGGSSSSSSGSSGGGGSSSSSSSSSSSGSGGSSGSSSGSSGGASVSNSGGSGGGAIGLFASAVLLGASGLRRRSVRA